MVSNFGLVMTLYIAENHMESNALNSTSIIVAKSLIDLMTCRYIITMLPQESELKCCGM